MGPEILDRIYHPKMEYYREVYAGSPRWNGVDDLTKKRVIIYCEQGFGDIIQFARYFSVVRDRCGILTLHCPKELHRLFAELGCQLLDKDTCDLPQHDYHILSMSLPFLLNDPEVKQPYLFVPEKMDLPEHEGYKKIGIAWEGNPDHSNAGIRNCPAKHFRLLDREDTRLFLIKQELHKPELLDGAEDLNLFGAELTDFYETAKLINAMDFVVSVDTGVLHLSGALGKPTYGLFSRQCDHRWDVKNWYDSMTMVRQKEDGDWDGVFSALGQFLALKGQL